MKRLALALSALLVLVACSGDSTGPTEASFAGAWTLKTINGLSLPVTVEGSGANKTEVLSDVLTFVAGGSFTDLYTFRYTDNGVVSTQSSSDAGFYSLNGTAVTFQYNTDVTSNTANVSGNTLTFSYAGFSYVFKK